MDHAATLCVLSGLTTTFCQANLLPLMILRRTRVDFRHIDAASQKVVIFSLQILSSIKRELPFSRLELRQFRETNILSKYENFRVTKSAIQRFVITMDNSSQMFNKIVAKEKQKKSTNGTPVTTYHHLNQHLKSHSEEKSLYKCEYLQVCHCQTCS